MGKSKFVFLLLLGASLSLNCVHGAANRALASDSGVVPIDWTRPGAKDEVLQILKTRRDQIKGWATLCRKGLPVDGPATGSDPTPFQNQFSCCYNTCGQGDLMIFGGFSSFGAYFGGDLEWGLARHNEQKISQGKDGRWWRGPSQVGYETTYTFSRDQGTGLMMYFTVALDRILQEKDLIKKEALRKEYATQFRNWLSWIENFGNGNMCLGSDQRCQINGLFGSKIFRIGKKLGAIDSTNENWKVVKAVKRWSQFTGGSSFAAEAFFTPIDYQMLLKMADLLMESYLGDLNPTWLKQTAREISAKDPQHTMYEFLYSGITPAIVQEALYRCPVQSPENVPWTISHQTGLGDEQWKYRTEFRPWETENGHGCLLLMNLMIAEMEGRIPWLHNRMTEASQAKACPLSNQKLGVFGEFAICEETLIVGENQSIADCLPEGMFWQKDATSQRYCLKLKNGFFAARSIQRNCPSDYEFKGMQSMNGIEWPVCLNSEHLPLSRVNCLQRFNSPILSFDSQRYCAIPQDGWYSLRKITRECPVGKKFLGDYWGDFAVCKALVTLPITHAACEKEGATVGYTYFFKSVSDQKDYCIHLNGRTFTARPIHN